MNIPLEKLTDFTYRIPKSYKAGMRVDGIIYADDRTLPSIVNDNALDQVANVAFLPGIVSHSLAMPDIHWGYGFCIGGVAATDISGGGVVSPGGVGFDINCGVRLLRTNIEQEELSHKKEKLINHLYNHVPSGIGSKGDIRLSRQEEKKLVSKGAAWAVARGMGVEEDLEYCENGGAIDGADCDAVSDRAYDRGKQQAGTLGSGNHFLEVQVIEEVFDQEIAAQMGFSRGQVTVMIHSGSRGFGYQICDEYARMMRSCLTKYKINVPDRQLACAPVESSEGRQYLSAMRAAANYAWANRQVLMHLVRESFEKVFAKSWPALGMSLVYDVAHNIAKIETHTVEGVEKKLCVHRKGATRAFGPKNPAIPMKYFNIGQPVIIPGDMRRASYVLVGTQIAQNQTFGTTCHGAGRLKSRQEALRTIKFDDLIKELKEEGIEVRAAGKKTIVEEAPQAYKNVNEVVDIASCAGIARKVCRMRPVCVVKG